MTYPETTDSVPWIGLLRGWPTIVGAQLARVSLPTVRRTNTLTICALTWDWRNELDAMRQNILARLPMIDGVRFTELLIEIDPSIGKNLIGNLESLQLLRDVGFAPGELP